MIQTDTIQTLADTLSVAPSVETANQLVADSVPRMVTEDEPQMMTDSVTSSEVVDTVIRYNWQNYYWQPDTVPADSVEEKEAVYGVLLTPPPPFEPPREVNHSFGMSYVLGGLFLIFIIIGIRFRNTHKYVGALLRDILETRLRHNVFDETVRETSFLMLLNLLWCCSSGVMLYGVIRYLLPGEGDSFPYPVAGDEALSTALCMGVAVAYSIFMCVSYYVVGNVFSDKDHALLWMKGFAATQGLLAFFYFPLALLFFCWPESTLLLLWIAAIVFILGKIVFIWKGMRIFFTQFSSWLLFLYYLCSLEIVPLILAYLSAVFLCGWVR